MAALRRALANLIIVGAIATLPAFGQDALTARQDDDDQTNQWPQFVALALIGTVLFSLALSRFRRTIGESV
ncbi:MAG: hypothetical protein HRU13_12205 [Phycisphaerales bacterium]|nr:hypothetical protein [Phycisphaerales bacterium]